MFPSYWSALPRVSKYIKCEYLEKNVYSDHIKLRPQQPQTVTKCLNGFLTAQPLKAHNVVSPWYWAEVYSQRAKKKKGGGGREIQSTCFLNGEFLEVRTSFHTETMARVHPAAFSLLLSLPILRLSICLWAETHGTSCSTQHTSQKFTSCSSALLLHTSTIPRTCINGSSFAANSAGDMQTDKRTLPLSMDTQTSPLCLSHTLMQLSTFRTLSSLFPPAQIWSDSGNTLCYSNGVGQGKEETDFHLNSWMRGSEGTEIPTTDIRPLLCFLTRMHMFAQRALTVNNVSFQPSIIQNRPASCATDSHAKFTNLCMKRGQTIRGWFFMRAQKKPPLVCVGKCS